MDGLVPKIYFSVLRTHSETPGAWFFPPVNAQEVEFLLEAAAADNVVPQDGLSLGWQRKF